MQSNMHTLGGRHAATDAMCVIDALLQPAPPLDAGGVPGEKANVEAAHTNVVAAGGVALLAQVGMDTWVSSGMVSYSALVVTICVGYQGSVRVSAVQWVSKFSGTAGTPWFCTAMQYGIHGYCS